MTVITYTVPLSLYAENNKTYAEKATILIKDCSSFANPNKECDGYNFNRCPNDDSYCQPFIQGDIIYNQIKYDRLKDRLTAIEFINSKTGADFFNIDSLTSQYGIDDLRNFYFNYNIDTSHASFSEVECFYVKLTFNPIEEGGYYYVTSEPYCLVSCDLPTLLVEGTYPNGYDCFGNYYGTLSGFFGGANIYKNHFRVYGVVEPDGFDFEETTMNNKRIKSKQSERFWLMTKKIPYYVAKQIAIAFNSKSVTIDGVEYTGTIKLNKNFDEGSMWIIKENIYIVCDEITFTCE